jgi:4-diphosphocytidyl-2-C-methyl-D-erythritol kinase
LSHLVSPHHRDFSDYPDALDLGGGGFALFAPAKINLALRVIGRRADGYHQIETWYQEISLRDRLEFRPSQEWRLDVRGADLNAGEENLICRAARLLSQEANLRCAAHVTLYKEIPLASGLGGGSSDAAVALVGLCRLWRLPWGADLLVALAAQIGSDCPFFLYGGLAYGSGRGEIVKPLKGCIEGTLVLVVPSFGVSTGWAYEAGRFPLTDEAKSVILDSSFEEFTLPAERPCRFHNDLENIVLSRHSELGWVKQKLLDFGPEGVCLSGSGSAVYGVFSDPARASQAAQQFGLPYRVIRCRAVSRPRRA